MPVEDFGIRVRGRLIVGEGGPGLQAPQILTLDVLSPEGIVKSEQVTTALDGSFETFLDQVEGYQVRGWQGNAYYSSTDRTIRVRAPVA